MAARAQSSPKSLYILTCLALACMQCNVTAQQQQRQQQHNNSVYYAQHNNSHSQTGHTYNTRNKSVNIAFPEAVEYAAALNASSNYGYDEYEDELDIGLGDKDFEVYEYLRRTSVIFGVASMANGSNVNVACSRQMRQIQHGILRKEPWAMKGEFSFV